MSDRDPFGMGRQMRPSNGAQARTLDLMKHVKHETTGEPVNFITSYTSSPDETLANVKASIRLMLPQCQPMTQDNPKDPVILLCGGPSLNDFEDQIIERKLHDGAKLVTVNGTYKWALDRGLGPVSLVMADGRVQNADFIHESRDDCSYFLASQCHPAVFERAPEARTAIWHCLTFPEREVPILNDYYFGSACWYPVMGMSTVATRAIMLLTMLGFERIEIFGLDSCYRGKDHHAFPQPLNDGSPAAWVSCAGKKFYAASWMIGQAADFLEMMYGVLQQANVELLVHGDGLIAHMIEVGANLPDEGPT